VRMREESGTDQKHLDSGDASLQRSLGALCAYFQGFGEAFPIFLLDLPQVKSEVLGSRSLFLCPCHFAKFDSSRMMGNCSRPSDAAVGPGFAGFAVQTGRDERQPHETRYSP
jgi:hypothetical protein